MYVDGFIIPVPKGKRDAYRRMAAKAGKVWRDLGALEYRECIADDVKPSETVWFSYIVYKNRKHRDQVVAKVMKDKRLASMMDPKAMPFDGKRMIYGGFKVSVGL